MSSYYRDIIALLKEAGWELHRQGKGSHEIWINTKTGFKLTVPFDCRKRNTANGILKQAGIDKKL